MVRKALALALVASGLAAFAAADGARRFSNAPYRIQLRKTAAVLSKDQPVRRGSVVLFHRYPDGRLTSVPLEDVDVVVVASGSPVGVAVRMTSGTPIAGAPAVPLQPGDAILLGPTGEGNASASSPTAAGAPSPSAEIPARLAVESQVFPGDLPAPTGGTGAPGAMGNGAPGYGAGSTANPNGRVGTVINPTLQMSPSTAPVSPTATSPTAPVAPNGYPATAAPPTINPNGFPATTTTGPQSGAQPVAPNGYPAAPAPGSQTQGTASTPHGS